MNVRVELKRLEIGVEWNAKMTFFSIFKCNVIVDVVLSVSFYKLIARTSKKQRKINV